MTRPTPLLRLPAVLATVGASRSTWYRWVADGLAPQPVRLGPNTSAWPAAEIGELIAARIAGADDAAVRELVTGLHAARASGRVPAAV